MLSPAMSTVATDAAARLLLVFRRAAFAAAALTFVVIVASAFMRHTQAGLACDDWPACYGRIATSAAGTDVVPTTGVRLARIAHRLAATGVLAFVIGLLLVAWTQKPAWKREGSPAWRMNRRPRGTEHRDAGRNAPRPLAICSAAT
jgi:heme A synthase